MEEDEIIFFIKCIIYEKIIYDNSYNQNLMVFII